MAQTSKLKVSPEGATMGNPRSNNDYNDEVTVEILGLGSDAYRAGSKMAFGDYGAKVNYGSNVTIGEWGNTDSDRLHLHGKSGINFSTNGDERVRMYLSSNSNLYVKGGVFVNQSWVGSDRRLKKNIKTISNGLELISELNPVSYDLIGVKQELSPPNGNATPKEKEAYKKALSLSKEQT